MNSFEQIMIRMNVDAKAVVSGLNKTSSFIKGWGAELKETMSKGLGKMFAVDFAIEQLKRIQEKILEVKTLSENTGASTNFVQSLMLEAEASGESVEGMAKGLTHFNVLLGQAKEGMPAALVMLHDLGVIADKNEAKTKKYAESLGKIPEAGKPGESNAEHASATEAASENLKDLNASTGQAQVRTMSYTDALKKLAQSYEETGDEQKRAAMLQDAFGKGGYKLGGILKEGAKGIEKMEGGNWTDTLTKFSADTIATGVTTAAYIKGIVGSLTVTTANLIAGPFNALRQASRVAGAIMGGAKSWTAINQTLQQMDESTKKEAFEKSMEANADAEGITVQQKKAEIINQQNELLERQKELTSEIDDRNKSSISEMAAHARKMLGIREPVNYKVSKLDREALRIDTMEKQAKIAYEQGDETKGKKLTSEALQLRSGFKEATLKDRDPMGKTNVELEKVNLQLAPVKKMADMIVEQHTKPQ